MATMKRTWVVIVQQGCGHELHDSLHSADIYGPYTQEAAEKLSERLNRLFQHWQSFEREPMEAAAEPLDCLTAKQVADKYDEMFSDK